MNKLSIREIEHIDLEDINLNIKNFKLIPKEFMYKYCLVPIEIDENMVQIAMDNPEDEKVINDLRFLISKNLKIYKAEREQIYSLIKVIDEMENTELILDQLKLQSFGNSHNSGQESKDKLKSSIENSPVVKISDSIISQAINKKASDIHMEPFEGNVIIRFRVDGILYEEYSAIPKNIYSIICSRIKLQAGMDIAEKRIPQDGKFQFKYINKYYDLRVSTLPTIYGEKIVIRILYKQESLVSLDSLGYKEQGKENMVNILKKNHGIILVTGPTGSGKTTTLYAMLSEIDKKHKNIVTIEDPVEMPIYGINQMNVNVKAKLTFANGLRSILRQDPNIIMIGEIRDEETAQIAVRAAITGHLVISTLHTSDSASSIIRLMDMHVPNYLVSDSLLVSIAQRLVRTICNNCRIPYKSSLKEQSELALKKEEIIYKGAGCVFCNNTGYKGRTVVYEMMIIDDEIRKIISENRSVDELRKYNKNKGMKSIRDNCRELVRAGITTYEEFVKICNNNY